MRHGVIVAGALLAWLACAAAPAAAGGARRAMGEGLSLLAERKFGEAVGSFEEAAAKAGDEGLDPAVARYNRAGALLGAGKSLEAAAAYAEAAATTDPALREKAHYNRGVALTAAAEALETAGDAAKAIALLDQALGACESAMRIDPDDEDPKVNHELVSRKKARLEEKLRQGEKSREEPREKPDQETRPRPEQETSPDEARMMLEALKQQETSQRSRIRPFRGMASRVEKNW